MSFTLRQGIYKNKTIFQVRRFDPWYLSEMATKDPQTWASLSKPQREICEKYKVVQDLELVDRLADLIDGGITKGDLQDVLDNDPSFKDISQASKRKYITYARAKYKQNFLNKQKEVIAVHARRYDEMYESRINLELPPNIPEQAKREIMIDAYYTASEILHAKEKLYGLHSTTYHVRVINAITDEKRKINLNAVHHFDVTEITTEELRRVIQLLDKASESQFYQPVIQIKPKPLETRVGSMVDWSEIEKEQVVFESNAQDQYVDYEEIPDNSVTVQIPEEQPPVDESGITLQEAQKNILKTDQQKLIEALVNAGSKTVKKEIEK